MTNVINNYETIFVIDASLPEEQITAISDKFKAMIEANGKLESVDVWGKRRLAYPIDYKTEGYYVLVNFASQAEFVAELERVYNITDGLLRTIVIRK
ncbi:MAG: 30S ribosomal protein S6 [Ruminococcaceae bacterium]|nr:30S ribosomal protein S6 [Oscillospiraceae bacterium]